MTSVHSRPVFDVARTRSHAVADHLGMPDDDWPRLLYPERTVAVFVPFRMDGGRTEVRVYRVRRRPTLGLTKGGAALRARLGARRGRSRVIDGSNAGRLRCRILPEGADGPTMPEADRIPGQRRDEVLVIPDILAGFGGVVVSCPAAARAPGLRANFRDGAGAARVRPPGPARRQRGRGALAADTAHQGRSMDGFYGSIPTIMVASVCGATTAS